MTAEHYVSSLRAVSEKLVETYSDESRAVAEAAEFIERQHRALQVYERIRNSIKHSNPERTGAYFVCGGSAVDPDLGVPDRVEICPAMGSDVVYVYERTGKGFAPEW
jgi:hypothetical protein